MSIKIIQLGVAGFGATWRHALRTTPDAQIVALVDTDPNALREAAQELRVSEQCCILRRSKDDESWTRVNADVVIDSTPQSHHYTNAMQTFSSNKHLIVVKPMSDAWETGVAMVKASEKWNRKMVVAQQLRFHPVILKLREMVQSGTLGQVGYIHQDAFFSRTGYSGSYPQPYPLLVQGAIHFFDYLRWVLAQQPTTVWAECFNPPWTVGEGLRCAYAVFKMSGGCRVCFRGIATETNLTNWTCDWRIEGEKGILTVENNRMRFNGKEVRVTWEDGTAISDLNLSTLNKIIFERFVNYLHTDEVPGFSGRNNLKSLEMAFGAIRSSQTGKRYVMEQDSY